jgi:hypothetical protein
MSFSRHIILFYRVPFTPSYGFSGNYIDIGRSLELGVCIFDAIVLSSDPERDDSKIM